MAKSANPKRRTDGVNRTERRRLATPHQAAEVLVRNLTRQVCGDFLDLIEDEGHDSHARARDYDNVKNAVRLQHQLPTHDIDRLLANVLGLVPENVRASVKEALDTYIDAAADEAIVQENSAYILGVTVGRAFGLGAQLRKPF